VWLILVLLGADPYNIRLEASLTALARELRAERAQLEMQLVVARVAVAAAVTSEASARASLEAA
jgi:hypothetical protein